MNSQDIIVVGSEDWFDCSNSQTKLAYDPYSCGDSNSRLGNQDQVSLFHFFVDALSKLKLYYNVIICLHSNNGNLYVFGNDEYFLKNCQQNKNPQVHLKVAMNKPQEIPLDLIFTKL